MIECYADVFRAAGLNYTESFTSLYESHPADLSAMEAVAGTKNGKWIGIAPFAKHRGKIYPVDDMEQVVARLSENEDYTIFLLGGRGYEEAVLEQWAFQYPRVKSLVGRYSLDNELALISQLDVLLCMDSANMHFASLVGTKVISVWERLTRMRVFMVIIRTPKMQSSWIFPAVPVPYSDRSPVFGGLGMHDTDNTGNGNCEGRWPAQISFYRNIRNI